MTGRVGDGPRSEGSRWLRRLLRFQGTVDLLAVLVPLLPTNTISRLHEAVGLGSFPKSPIADYLARNLPLLVVLHGLLLWGVSADLPRYRPLISLLGWSAIAHGVGLVVIDWQAGLPGWWVLGEGPLRALLGVAMLLLLQSVPRSMPAAGEWGPDDRNSP